MDTAIGVDPGSREARLAAYNAAVEASDKDPSLSPETGKPVSKSRLFRFGVAFTVFGVFWAAGLNIVSSVLLPQHLQQLPGVSAELLLGIINS